MLVSIHALAIGKLEPCNCTQGPTSSLQRPALPVVAAAAPGGEGPPDYESLRSLPFDEGGCHSVMGCECKMQEGISLLVRAGAACASLSYASEYEGCSASAATVA